MGSPAARYSHTLRGFTPCVSGLSWKGIQAARQPDTIPGKVLKAMLAHPLTESGIERFTDDWKSRPEFGDWLKGLVEESTAASR